MTLKQLEVKVNQLEQRFAELQRALRLPSAEDDASIQDWMSLQVNSGAFDDWRRPEEDIYTETDGEPV